MKTMIKFSQKLSGLLSAVNRFLFAIIFLVVATVINAVSIFTENNHPKLFLSCMVGAMIGLVLQVTWERFFLKKSQRILLIIAGAVITLVYYVSTLPSSGLSLQISIRTFVAMVALFFAFIWIPVLRSKISFNESFMATFKGVFHSVFFAIILFAGCSLILAAIDLLITYIDEKMYLQIANIIFVLFTPIFFLSRIPIYPGQKSVFKDEMLVLSQEEKIAKASSCPEFLGVLISYIIIPLSVIYTIIILLYIVLNIRGRFWSNNLLEPLLVTFAVTIIIVYLLSSRLKNNFTNMFRLVLPKVMVPIVIFQLIASVLKILDTGITHNRYYVILFGIFAVLAGIVMSVLPVRKNGIIAGILIAFCAISIVPPVDAFTISRHSQKNVLESLLLKNDMLTDNKITPKDTLSDVDKKKIILAVNYLEQMNYLDELSWMPDNFNVYTKFYDTFGFSEYQVQENETKSIFVSFNLEEPFNISGFDFLTRVNFNYDQKKDTKIGEIKQNGKTYTLNRVEVNGYHEFIILDENNQKIFGINTESIFDRYKGYNENKNLLTKEEATIINENDKVKVMIVIQELNSNVSFEKKYNFLDAYILIKFK